jgi:hypothetical protein
MKSLHFSEKEFKKPQNRSKYLKLQEKPHITLKNFSISSKKNRNLYKSFIFSENIFKLPRILKYKKASHSQKKASQKLPHCHNG